jgi:hypothetical protein
MICVPTSHSSPIKQKVGEGTKQRLHYETGISNKNIRLLMLQPIQENLTIYLQAGLMESFRNLHKAMLVSMY